MNVLLLSQYPPFAGGIETRSFNMVTHMDIPFTVVSPLLPDHNKCPHLDVDPAVVYLDYSNMGSFLNRVQDIVSMEDIGVIDVQCNVYLGVLGMMLSQKTKIPLISSFHMNLEYPDYAEAAFFAAHKDLIEQVINESDKIVCVSKSVKQSLIHFSSVSTQKDIRVIHNGVDVTVFSPRKEKENALLFVGRFSKEKNIPFLLKLYKEIAKKEDIALWLVGDGPERKSIEALAQKLAIDITFWGILTGEALAHVYAAAAVTVSPSVTEAFGMTTLESIACGTPVLASCNPGTKELMQNVKGGVLFEVGNHHHAVTAFNQLMKDYSYYRNQGLKNVQKFSWNTVLSPLEKMYRDYL